MRSPSDCVVYRGSVDVDAPEDQRPVFVKSILKLQTRELCFEFDETSDISEALRLDVSVAQAVAVLLCWYFYDDPGLWSLRLASSFEGGV
nr:MAG TPA: hypothetical protein [Inoviridae sp.]